MLDLTYTNVVLKIGIQLLLVVLVYCGISFGVDNVFPNMKNVANKASSIASEAVIPSAPVLSVAANAAAAVSTTVTNAAKPASKPDAKPASKPDAKPVIIRSNPPKEVSKPASNKK